MLEVCKDKNIRLRVKKISLSDVWEEKKLKYALIALFKEERHGIIA
jgi:hypothetical protein